jgi:predicted P-loop ATPase
VAKVVSLPVPVPVPPSVRDKGDANAERNKTLFEWALNLLKKLGIAQALERAGSIEELRRISLNMEDGEITLAIRDALHPAGGDREPHFVGLREGSLKQILRNRFVDLKKDREKKLRGRGRSQRDWSDDLILDKAGNVKANLHNVILILREALKWKGVLAFDEFNARVVIKKSPPWGGVKLDTDTPWTDHYDSLTRVWFQQQNINAAAGDVGRGVQAAAKHNAFHPVRGYFNGLLWDGVPRLDTWLIDYLHADDSSYVRAIGPRFLISGVARIYQPGCKVDHMLVLEGPQGKLKSEALRALAVKDAWFTDRLSNVTSKDAAQEMAGVWLIEIAELDALARSSASAKKAFLTRRSDRFRPPFGKHLINLPRQCVFAGTINPPATGYLTDPTGARRFWPVACERTIDREGLERNRDQLWAEAVVRFKAGEKWWLETTELEALATAEQQARFIVDAWEAPIRKWLGRRRITNVSNTEVLCRALGFASQDCTQSAQNRVAKILTHLGFIKYRPRTKGRRKRRYRLSPEPKKS